MFELSFTPELIAVYSAAVVSILIILLCLRRAATRVAGRVAYDSEHEPEGDQWPDVSVIVYSKDDAWNLEACLRSILTQDYAGKFEVIVVNDGAVSATEAVIGKLEKEFGNLYMTFTPLLSKALSRKKLAVTLGVKAARYEVVVNTLGTCRISSDKWLRDIAAPFARGKEVVIGYATSVPAEGVEDGDGLYVRSFDTVLTAVKYLSRAISGHPYRGNSANLAYRRSLFFKNKGFSRSLNLNYGDDDIFVSEISNGRNTAVVLSDESIIEVLEQDPVKAHRQDKLQHNFTSRRLAQAGNWIVNSSLVAWWVLFVTLIAGAIIGLPSIIPAIVSAVVIVTMSILMMTTWRTVSRSLKAVSLFFTVPFLMLWQPLYNGYYQIVGFLERKKNMTWGV